jgi:hypothetical protein
MGVELIADVRHEASEAIIYMMRLSNPSTKELTTDRALYTTVEQLVQC